MTVLVTSQVAANQSATAAQYNNLRDDVINLGGDMNTTAGSANAYTLALDAQFNGYVQFGVVKFKASFTNTGAATLNVNSIGAITIKKQTAAGLADVAQNDILSGLCYSVVYDGTYFQLIGGGGSGDRLIVAMTAGEAIDGTTTPQAVYLAAADGKIYKTDSSATEGTFKFIGFTKANIGNGSAGPVIVEGVVDGFTGLTANSDYFPNGTGGSRGAISITTGTYKYRIARALSTTAIKIDRGAKVALGFDSFTTSAAGANALTVTLGFKPKTIKLKYFVVGHGSSTGSPYYYKLSGIADFEETTMIDNFIIGYTAPTDSNGSPYGSGAYSGTSQAPALDNTTALSAGVNSGSGAIMITITIASVSDTGFVINRTTAIGTTPSPAYSRLAWEAIG